MFCFYVHETVFEGVLQCIGVPSVGCLAACCAGMRGGMVDDEGRLLAGGARITGDPALAHAVIRLVSPKLLQCVDVEECGTNICHSDFQHVFALLEVSRLQILRMWTRNAHLLGDITVQGLAAVLPRRLQELDLRFGDLGEDGPSSAVANDGLRALTAALPNGLKVLRLSFRACRLTN